MFRTFAILNERGKLVGKDNVSVSQNKGDKNIPDTRWLRWMLWGEKLGCHQMAERSFFYKGYQFPVCARCTGVIVSSVISCIVFAFYHLNWKLCVFMCAVMFVDWLIQWMDIRESTNLRRLITGLIGGYGFMTLQLYVYKIIIEVIIERVF